jgi:predicted Fe-S protein YdhL (DUF1289 family)
VIPSPCIDICRLNNNGICIGCGRTKQEITDWLASTDKERVAIYEKATVRLKTIFDQEYKNVEG